MNNLHPPARFFPYVALAARYQQDSGDGDGDPLDYIEDKIHQWHNKPLFKRVLLSHGDFNYIVETESEVILSCLGTEGRDAWIDNFDALPITGHMHKSFGEAGEELFNAVKQFIRVGKEVTIITHSRGGPRGLRCQEILYDYCGKKALIIEANGPPLYTKRGIKRYQGKRLPGYRIANMCDAVDDLGKPLLRHPKTLQLMKLPYVKNRLNSIPIIGWLFGGHAYTSDIDGMIAYYHRRNMMPEIKYLKSRMDVCTI